MSTSSQPPPRPQSSAAGMHFIGSQISLTTRVNLRYTGTLCSIDTANSTVALQNVRSLGTEDRIGPQGHVPPSDQIFDYIVFRGPDILDLQIIHAPQQPPPAHPSVIPPLQPGIMHQGPQMPPPYYTQQQYQPMPPQPRSMEVNGPVGQSVPSQIQQQRAAQTGQPGQQVRLPPQSLERQAQQIPSRPVQSSPIQSQVSQTESKQAVAEKQSDVQEKQGVQAQSKKIVSPQRKASPTTPVSKISESGAPEIRTTTEQKGTPASKRPHQTVRGWGPPPTHHLKRKEATHTKSSGTEKKEAGKATTAASGDANGIDGESSKTQEERTERASTGRGGKGGSAGRLRGRRGGRGRHRQDKRRGPGITVPDEDFDFESMNEKFSKITTEPKESEEGTPSVEKIALKYDKKTSFFDELVLENQMPRQRMTEAERRREDMVTFGETGGFSHTRYGRGRGRGRRGRGGHYGRGRPRGRGYGYFRGGGNERYQAGRGRQEIQSDTGAAAG